MKPQTHTNHLPHLVMIAVLAFGAYSLPSVQDAMAGGFDVIINSNADASTTIQQRILPHPHAQPPQRSASSSRPMGQRGFEDFDSASSSAKRPQQPGRPAGCPEGYHCLPIVHVEGCPAGYVCIPEMMSDRKSGGASDAGQFIGNRQPFGTSSNAFKPGMLPPRRDGQQGSGIGMPRPPMLQQNQ
ncbi:MAG: hypothetical protein JWO73_173 [Candidatus Taylorbacteria bacterium]|nr:hypothetical protein [Candidatus Taylorbacteria bacterium]